MRNQRLRNASKSVKGKPANNNYHHNNCIVSVIRQMSSINFYKSKVKHYFK